MSDFDGYIRNHPFSIVLSVQIVERASVRYGFVITRALWFALRLYVEHRIEVHENSELGRLFLENGEVPFSYHYYKKENSKISFCFVELLEKKDFMFEKDAELEKINYVFPECKNMKPYILYQEFSQENEKKANLVEQIKDLKGFQIISSEIKMSYFMNSSDIFYFKDFDHRYCVEQVDFKYLEVPFCITKVRADFHRTWEIRDERDRDTNGMARSRRIHYVRDHFAFESYIALYGYDKSNKKKFITQSRFDIKFLRKLLERDWSNLFEPQVFMETMTVQKIHTKNWSNMKPDEIQKTLEIGSVILIKRDKGALAKSVKAISGENYYHAAVYLGCDLVIHVKFNDDQNVNEPGKIFGFDDFKKFAENDTELKEISFKIPKMTKKEQWNRVLDLNQKIFRYSVLENNCEHIAFYSMTEFKYCSQLTKIRSKRIAMIADYIKPLPQDCKTLCKFTQTMIVCGKMQVKTLEKVICSLVSIMQLGYIPRIRRILHRIVI